MKKILLAAALLVSAGTFANAASFKTATETTAREINASNVPPAIIAQFNTDFPGAVVIKWEKQREHGQLFYVVTFKLNGVKMHKSYAA